MKEQPILFSGPMVRALLREDNPKTQTRRIVKPQPAQAVVGGGMAFGKQYLGPDLPADEIPTLRWAAWCKEDQSHRLYKVPCPYGQPGDRLWVRETWQPLWATKKAPPDGFDGPDGWAISYPATDGIKEYYDEYAEELSDRCRPSIHMPRWASRITLEVTGVRVERLQDITEADAIAEGVEANIDDGVTYYGPFNQGHADPRVAYQWLWESINGPGSWDLNPWVWVVEFRRLP